MTHPHEYRDKWTSFQDLEKSIFFFCDNGIISFVGVCDGNADCLDGGDERNCKGSVGRYFFHSSRENGLIAIYSNALIIRRISHLGGLRGRF